MVHGHHIKEEQDYNIAKPIVHLVPQILRRASALTLLWFSEVKFLLKNYSNSEITKLPLLWNTANGDVEESIAALISELSISQAGRKLQTTVYCLPQSQDDEKGQGHGWVNTSHKPSPQHWRTSISMSMKRSFFVKNALQMRYTRLDLPWSLYQDTHNLICQVDESEHQSNSQTL